MKSYAIANLEEGSDETTLVERVGVLSSLEVDLIQLRAKHLDDRDLADLAHRCRRRISSKVLYLVNGRADIAVAAGADGVHLPSDGVPIDAVRSIDPRLMIGVSCHSVREVEKAAGEGADLVVLGPVFEARSCSKPSKISMSDLREASGAGVDVYALGGMTENRLPLLEGTAVRGVAAVTMFMQDEPIDEIVAAVRGARA